MINNKRKIVNNTIIKFPYTIKKPSITMKTINIFEKKLPTNFQIDFRKSHKDIFKSTSFSRSSFA